MDTIVEMYQQFLFELLDKHAPLKNIKAVDIPLNEWMTDNVLALKAIRRKNEFLWRKTRITINFNIYYDSCMAVKKVISKRKAEIMDKRLIIVKVTRIYQLFLFGIFNKHFFIEKIHMIKLEFPLLEACLQACSLVDVDIILPVCIAIFDTFQPHLL